MWQKNSAIAKIKKFDNLTRIARKSCRDTLMGRANEQKCRQIKRHYYQTEVIYLSARSKETDALLRSLLLSLWAGNLQRKLFTAAGPQRKPIRSERRSRRPVTGGGLIA